MSDTLSPELLQKMDAYWRAANYLTVGQIYLKENPLLEVPLRLEHIKTRLLGHWGTTTGLNFIYVHLNRLIKLNDLDMICIIGPGHGGPGLVAHTYLEGSYSEIYPNIDRSRNGMQRLFRQFSWPYGIPSHVAPETPGSIHEGGELGYSLAHAYGAAFDNPDLIVACIVGDGEAETGPLATSWHSNKFLNPVRDGAVLPILHLNGFKIANPTVLARISRQELTDLLHGYGYEPHFVAGDEPAAFTPRHRVVHEMHRRHPGLRLVRTGLVLEALIPSVLEQKVTSDEAYRAWRLLLQRHGEPAPGPLDGLRVMPEPRGWALIPSWEWHRAGVDAKRSATILRAVRVARRMEEAATLPPERASARLQAIPGIGPWTAAEVLQRSNGDPDAVTVGDLHLPNTIGYALTGAQRTDDARMLELLQPYAGQRHRAARLILLSGRRPPRRAPRFAPRDIASI